jgi:hypothetical protein
MGSMQAFNTQVGVFNPGQSRWIFKGKKTTARLSSEGK